MSRISLVDLEVFYCVGVTDAERDAAWKRIQSAARKHDVELHEGGWRELA